MPKHLKLRVITCLIFPLGLVACAGPTTPFGAPTARLGAKGLPPSGAEDARGELDVGTDTTPEKNDGLWPWSWVGSSSRPRIFFRPGKQVHHGKTRFLVEIEDQFTQEDRGEYRLFYNGADISERFLSRARIRTENEEKKKIQVSLKSIFLSAESDHQIEFFYRRNAKSKWYRSVYAPPSCEIQERRGAIHYERFRNAEQYRRLIESSAREQEVNSALLAGLIAQESGFRRRSVSWSRAIGLTQITTFGQAEILKDHPDWPSWVGISELPIPVLKLKVMTGEIDAAREWRLDPKLSIQGGAEYLQWLLRTWGKVTHGESPSQKNLTNLVLASYNSGITRVMEARKQHGVAWLERSTELAEARRYVRRIHSFCEAFSRADQMGEEAL